MLNWKGVGKELPDERHHNRQLLVKIDHNCGYMVVRWDNNNKRFMPESYCKVKEFLIEQGVAGQLITGISDWAEIDSGLEPIKDRRKKHIAVICSGVILAESVKKYEVKNTIHFVDGRTGIIAKCGLHMNEATNEKGTIYIEMVNCKECMALLCTENNEREMLGK